MSKLIDQYGNSLSNSPEPLVAHVPLQQFRVMQHDLMFLTCLKAIGVDKWEGYEDAIEMHKKMKDDVENRGKEQLKELKEGDKTRSEQAKT